MTVYIPHFDWRSTSKMIRSDFFIDDDGDRFPLPGYSQTIVEFADDNVDGPWLNAIVSPEFQMRAEIHLLPPSKTAAVIPHLHERSMAFALSACPQFVVFGETVSFAIPRTGGGEEPPAGVATNSTRFDNKSDSAGSERPHLGSLCDG
jgi:hypothetical protein